MIKAEKVSKNFGKHKAADNVSFFVPEGETLMLLGTSGCGKTTLLRLINRLLDLSGGSIFINGKNIADQKPELLRRGMGYVLQNHGLFPHYTASENISVVPKLLNWDKQRIETRISELLEKLHLPAEIANAYPNELSGGQQQRIGLARALAADPPILLMDEPFGALDPITRASIRKEFKQLDELRKKTIIMVTHDVQEAFELGDRICLLNNGKVEQTGTPSELLFKPESDFTSNFLSDQRLQLEFQTIKIASVWHLLDELAPAKNAAAAADANTDLWSAMNCLSANESAQITFKHQNSLKTAGLAELMKAFYLYKNKNQ